MNRRSFLGVLGGIGLVGRATPGETDEEKRTRFYVLESFRFQQGEQGPRMHEFFSKTLLPALNRVHKGPKLYMDALVAPHVPTIVALYGFPSLQELGNVHTRVIQDQELMKASAAFESAVPPLDHQENVLLEAADYSPEIVAGGEPSKSPRIFELRVYHSPTWGRLHALHERFAGPETKIFQRVGIHPILYGSTIIGPNMPNLTYLIPFEDLAAREKAWAAFAADPEWIKVRKESAEKHGQVASVLQISLFRATGYSPVR